MKKAPVLILFLTVFIDLVGFGIVLPLLPLFSKTLDAPSWLIGVIMAAYSAMQFIFAPIWGRLSDRVGRRPILLLSTIAAAGSYAIFAVGSGMSGHAGLAVLLVSRLVAGICGANITVAQAYIADVTPPDKRSARMGLVGMAFGLGFIFGPAIGGLCLKHLGVSGPGWVAAAICASNFLLAFWLLPESRTPSTTAAPPRPHLDQWMHTLSRPRVGLLVSVFFLATFCFTCFETTLGLLVSRNFNLDLFNEQDTSKITFLYTFCGVIGALVQGGAVGRLVRALGEPRLIACSMVCLAASLVALPFVTSWAGLLTALAMLSVGSSLTRPPVFGLISTLTDEHEQGATLGVTQGAGSLARIAGPVFAGAFFGMIPALPYVICGVIALFTALLVWRRLVKSTRPNIAGSAENARG